MIGSVENRVIDCLQTVLLWILAWLVGTMLAAWSAFVIVRMAVFGSLTARRRFKEIEEQRRREG